MYIGNEKVEIIFSEVVSDKDLDDLAPATTSSEPSNLKRTI